MGLPRGTNALLLALLLLLAAGLGVVATLQYRWIDRVSEAERQQLRANIDFAARRFTDDLRGEMDRLFESFADPERGEPARRYEEWLRNAPHPRLVETLYLVQRTEESWSLRVLNRATLEMEEAAWPPALDGVRRRLDEEHDRPRIRWPRSLMGEASALFIPPRPLPPEDFLAPRRPPTAVIVMIDRKELAAILSGLADRYFSTATKGEYDLALSTGPEIIYRSNPSWPDGRTAADFELPFIALNRGPLAAPRRPPDDPPPNDGPPNDGPPNGRPNDRPPPQQPPPQPPMWTLLVRHHDGSLNTLIASARRRNLAISSATLFILFGTMLLLAALLRRANRLRAQQTQFVAAMSHELNTPIAALRSAGENLKDGIVADPDKLARYGETIVKESARLGDMVAQVLEFAGMQARTRRPALLPVDVDAVIGEAVAQCHWILDGSKIDVEVKIDDDLPTVRGDAAALTRAVQNLIANAIRHGGSGKWIGVRAARDNGGVTITVEDRGPGIDGREAARLFEPFYRGHGSGGVRGAGLGLAIVRQIAIAHGGSVDIDRRRRGGAAFAFHLPAAVDHA